jgi:hypothetical protein
MDLLHGAHALYFDEGDRLRLTTFGSLTGVVVAIEGRMVRPDGEIVRLREAHTPNSDRTSATSSFAPGAGWLLNLSLRASTGEPRIGQVFAFVDILRGIGTQVTIDGALLQGYVTATQRLYWPGSPRQSSIDGRGVMRSIVCTDPGAGGEILESVPTNARWLVHGLTFNYTTDANAANRVITIGYDDGALFNAMVVAPAAQAASLSYTYSFALGAAREDGSTVGRVTATLPQIALKSGSRVFTVSRNKQAGDDYGLPQLLVEEWIED